MSGTGPNVTAPEGALDEEAYGTRIEDAFIAERGTPFLLLSTDWMLIKGWREAGIPVDTAIRAIQETFERRRTRGRTGKIGSLAYCADAVEERWELERRALVGQGVGTRDVAPEGVVPRLSRLVAAFEKALTARPDGIDAAAYGKALQKTVEGLRELDASKGFDQLEDELSKAEAALVKRLLKALDEPTGAVITGRVEELLGDTAALPAAGRERIRRALASREVRRMLGLPALTLFDG